MFKLPIAIRVTQLPTDQILFYDNSKDVDVKCGNSLT